VNFVESEKCCKNIKEGKDVKEDGHLLKLYACFCCCLYCAFICVVDWQFDSLTDFLCRNLCTIYVYRCCWCYFTAAVL